MGLKIGRSLKKLAKGVVKALPFAAPFAPLIGGKTGQFLTAAGGAIGAGVPTIQSVTGVAPFFPMPGVHIAGRPFGFENGGQVVPAAGTLPVVAAGLTRGVVGAIVKLAGRLGVAVTAANLGRVGIRLWRSVTALARRYPGVSILTFLTGLGLTLDEAGEFLFWGQARRKRRRRGGISGRDLAVTKRTLRRLQVFRARVGMAARRPSRGRRFRGDGTVVVAQQD